MSSAGREGWRVYRDGWGVPHLRAEGHLGLAYAQGRNAARDRAWQLESERRRAEGTTAAFLGSGAVGWDRFARQVRLADTARRCHARLDADTAGWIGAYVAGVNDGLGEGAARAPEFADTGLDAGLDTGRWEPWTPLAVWLSAHILFAGFPAKLWRDMVTRRLGPELLPVFATDGPGTAGSNGWLLTGARTASGAPLLAGDPHRFIEVPGVYQQIRLACDEYDVVGLAVPGVPGLAHFGHAGGVAWAITNAMADYQDLYEERLRARPGTGIEALGPDGWEPAWSRRETVEVAGGEPVPVEIVETARGPVVVGAEHPGTPGEWAAISLRCPARADADLGFAALPRLLRARTSADIDRALDGWVEPVNVVQAADTAGGLLHRVAGRVPVRAAGNGRGIVPAWDARHAWTGGYAVPPRAEVRGGAAVMANARGLAEPLGVEFAAPYRARRIEELLAASRTWTAAETAAVHTDTYLGSAGALLGRLAAVGGLGGPETPAARLRDRLGRWPRAMDADSADAAAYAVLRAAVVRGIAAHPALAPLADPPPYPGVFLPWLSLTARVGFALDSLLTHGPLPDADLDAIVRAAAAEAAGEEPAVWGELHTLLPWQAVPDPEVPRPPLAGDHDCVLATTSIPGITHASPRGPAARYVWDLADRAESRWIVPFGADGVPGSPHHRDQLPLWLRGDLVPVVTDWDRLTATEEHLCTCSASTASAPSASPPSTPTATPS